LLQNYDIIVIDNNINSDINTKDIIEKITGKNIINFTIDLLDIDKLENIFAEYDIYCVLHFAGLKAVSESIKKPLLYYNTNITGTLNLLEIMSKYSCKKLIFSSSATVYGNQTYPVTENSDIGHNITNPYGKTKFFIEHILKDCTISDSEWSIVALRYFNPVGAHPSGLLGENPKGIPNNLFPHILNSLSGKQLTIYGNDYNTPDHTCVRDFIHVVDLANGHISALRKLNDSGYHTYNLGSGKGTSVLELISTFEKINNVKLNYKFSDRREGDLEYVYANVDKAYKELNWKTTKTIEDICKNGYDFYHNCF
jgi:UDP-glucose 4-epimerase